ncbi:MAG: metallophosphoesterase family protein [Deltaproteobacteria bacterium]
MKYAIISDIHANLESFQSVLEDIEASGAGRILCLGDIVGYGGDPNECVEIIRDRNITAIIGNHDAAACGISEPLDFNPVAREAVLWTRRELTDENSEFLRSLTAREIVDDFMIVHGAISDPDKYIISSYDAEDELNLFGERDLCFFGHTHTAVCFAKANSRIDRNTDEIFELQSGVKYLINPGSVGQPRDGDPRASFLVYDGEKGEAAFKRVEYDIKGAQEKIIKNGLNRILAERLSYGY